MERIFSIRELENMIEAIKTNNPHYGKRIEKYACGIFQIKEFEVQHRHVGNHEYKRISH